MNNKNPSKPNVLELSAEHTDSSEDEDEAAYEQYRKDKGALDFDSFKKEFNLAEILDKLVVKREFFIPN